jgi:hypothetical protein
MTRDEYNAKYQTPFQQALNKKPTFEERQKLIDEYMQAGMTRVERITADLKKEIMGG